MQLMSNIEQSIEELGRLVQAQLGASLRCLTASDMVLADDVVRKDQEVNNVRYQVEAKVEKEILLGADADRLRFLISTLSVINDLERMGDHAEGIAKVALMIGGSPARPVPSSLIQLGELVEPMLEAGLASFTTHDMDAARKICLEDDQVDELYDAVYGELFANMTADGSYVIPGTYLLWVAHNLERIADRVTNLCERTVYLATGKIEELNVSNY